MAPDMQARRDAFTFLTDEKAPAEPGRWLVTWGSTEVDFGWNNWSSVEEAAADANAARDEGFHEVCVYDLDNQ